MADGEVVESSTLALVRGDADNYLVTVDDGGDPAVVVDLGKAVDTTANRPAIARFSVAKDHRHLDNLNSLIFKTSYRADEIVFATQSGATKGQFTIFVDKDDTDGKKASAYCWDCEVTLQDFLRTGASAGTITTTLNSKVVLGSGTDFTKAKKGDVLHPTSGTNLNKPTLITKIVSATSIEVENGEYLAAAGSTFEVRRGLSRTIARGTFNLVDESTI